MDRERCFKREWIDQYFFILKDGKALCLICRTEIGYISHHNIKRHFNSTHAETYGPEKLSGFAREKALEEFKSRVNFENLPSSSGVSRKSLVHASYKICKQIATSTSKPFTDREFVKNCLITAAEDICPEQVNAFQSISLSRNIVAERISEMGDNLEAQLIARMKKFTCYSLALDESTD